MNETVQVGAGKARKVFTFLEWLSRMAGKVTLGDIANYKKAKK